MKERARLRKMAGLTQHQLARKVGKRAPVICLWERGEIELADADVQSIALVIEKELSKQPPVSGAAQILGMLVGVKQEQAAVVAR